MFGPSMLVAPVMEQGSSSREVFLPDSHRWYDAHTGVEVRHTSGWLSSNNKTTHKVCQHVHGADILLLLLLLLASQYSKRVLTIR